jgi:DNA-binding CsgD family transcriptional regulator
MSGLGPGAAEVGLSGRAAEQSAIDGLVADAGARRSGALVLYGEPGIGKTALVDYAVTTAARADSTGAPGLRVIRGAGVESEAELSFAGLHLLLGGALDRLPALPPPQQEALGAAFGVRRAEPYDRFLLGLSVLSLLSEIAEDRPLLCVVDDAQWLDRASADALLFAARRLDAEGIAMIFAARDPEVAFPASGLATLRLAGLPEPAARALLLRHGGAELTPQLRDRILAEAGGNPLGLIELPAAYRDAEAAGPPGSAAPGVAALPLTDRLRRAFGGQIRQLPLPTQDLLLIAAAEGTGDLGVILPAGDTVGATADDLVPAERAGLVVTVGRSVTFRHPLVRAAVYRGAALSRRLAAHRAVADALRRPADADRRAWQLAAAATGPDEAVAAELERAGRAATERRGYAAATAAYERALQLTTDDAARSRRLTLAAEASAQTGEFDRARSLATQAAAATPDPVLRARLARLAASADFGQGRLRAAHRLLVDGAADVVSAGPGEAAKMLMNAAHIAWFLGDRALLADAASRIAAVPRRASERFTPLVQLLLRADELTDVPAGGDAPGLAELIAEARRTRAGDDDDLAMIALISLTLGRHAEACELSDDLIAAARGRGRIGWLPAIMNGHAQALVYIGRQRDAVASAEEALRVAEDTGQPRLISEASAVLAYLASVAGDAERCHRLSSIALAAPESHRYVAAHPWAHWALGVLQLGQGSPEAALVELERIWRDQTRCRGAAAHSVPDLVEAAVRVGRPTRATGRLGAFTEWAAQAAAPRIDTLVERCRALVSTDDQAEEHYLGALALPDASFEHARSQLLYGAWLRRGRRMADGRAHLRAALEAFDRMGAVPWVQQARAELAATGAVASRPAGVGVVRLTGQELQVVGLAARGLSNKDIAAQLFLSPRTVAYHLYKAYPKLGITSRAELDLEALGS